MTAFPTLSSDARFAYPDEAYEDPAFVSRFENRSTERRSKWDSGRWNPVHVILRSNNTDIDAVFTFFIARRLSVESFTYAHPKLGTITVHYVGDSLPRKRLVDASTSWYEIQFALEQV